VNQSPGRAGAGAGTGAASNRRLATPGDGLELDDGRFIQWLQVERVLKRGEVNKAFEEVIRKGSLDDLARVMQMSGPRPEELANSVRNACYDGVATLLSKGHHVERCLVWTLALVRGGLVSATVSTTQQALRDALFKVAGEPSKRGMLAALLDEDLAKAASK
jgi:hypothetical protein